uniref:Uncharacterized protein n=1 Tax=Knipowitschia caucasica TaxID=637954 RepID=A0AAV2MKN1_KNICA
MDQLNKTWLSKSTLEDCVLRFRREVLILTPDLIPTTSTLVASIRGPIIKTQRRRKIRDNLHVQSGQIHSKFTFCVCEEGWCYRGKTETCFEQTDTEPNN